jgi:ATPase subunit of ABC transporter with duplicated ATPase domains
MALSAEVDLGIDGDVSLVKSLQEELGKARESLRRAQWLKLQDAVSSLAQRFEQNNDQYYRLRQEQQAANESLKQQTALTRGIEHIEKRAQELEAVIALERGLLDKRDAARAVIARVDDRIYELRIQEVDAINREHGDSVFLTLRTGTGAPAYSAHLSRLLGGSRIRAQEEVAAALALTFPPSELIDIVEGGNGQPLADALQRDAAQMNRVVAHLADHQGLYELEATPAVSGLEIALFDGNQRKPVESLSNGQRATALLPLILRPLPYPLLFDQPEDDLDNKFIYNSLIKSIRGLKHQRQLVFVTHNANIPVLGGADRVVVMRMRSPDSADEPLVGTVEERKQEVLDLLEGGAEAFRRRERQYHDLLGGDDAADKGAP